MAKGKKETEENEVLKFCKAIIEGKEPPNNEYSKLLDFSEEYGKQYKEVENSRPYHLNILNEVREKDSETGRKILDENFHSRVLCKLLQYKEKGKYVFLNCFLKYINRKKNIFGKDIIMFIPDEIATQKYFDDSNIYNRRGSIDIFIKKRKKCAIILENKILNAQDGYAQLAKYIDFARNKENFEDREIFVIYLTDSYKEPENKTWGEIDVNLKQTFKERFINISYKNDIIKIIEQYLKDNDNKKEFLFNSAIEQYLDYLKGLYDLRDDSKTNEILIKLLNMNKMKDNFEKINRIENMIRELEDLQNGLDNLRNEYRDRIIKGWRDKTKKTYLNWKTNTSDFSFTDVVIKIKNKELLIQIGDDDDGEGLYCQAELDMKSGIKQPRKPEVIKKLEELLPESDPVENSIKEKKWKIWKRCDSYKKAYELFNKVIEKCINEFVNKDSK